MFDEEQEQPVMVGFEPQYNSAADLRYAVENYFNDTPRKDWTMGGLSFALGLGIDELRAWASKDSEYQLVLRQALTLLGSEYEKDLRHRGKGDVFAMKQFGWSDKSEDDGKGHQVVVMGDVRIGGEPVEFNVGKAIEVDDE